MTDKPVKVYPFLRQGNTTLAVSWLLSYDVNTSQPINTGLVCDTAVSLGLHPITLKRQLCRINHNKYFSLERDRGGEFLLSRSNVTVSLCYSYLPTSLLNELSPSESILLAAISFFKRNNKPVPPRHTLSARTGFSMRQISYSLKSLTQKGLLVSRTQHESYVRHSKEKGRIEDVRDRMSYTLSDKAFNKIAPLKDVIRFPVKNRFLQQSKFFDELFNFYGNHFQVHPFESVSGCRKYFHDHGDKTLSNDQLLEAVRKATSNRFLKLANRFGWQEGVTACYEYKGHKEYLTDNSYHINKYKSHKPGLGWILKHARDILDGKYDERGGESDSQKDLTKQQISQIEIETSDHKKHFHVYNNGKESIYSAHISRNVEGVLEREKRLSDKNIDCPMGKRGNQSAYMDRFDKGHTSLRPLHVQTTMKPKKPTLEEEIERSYASDERSIHLMILKQTGEGVYRRWIKPCIVNISKTGKVRLKSPNRFMMDMIYQKVILPLNLQHMIQVE